MEHEQGGASGDEQDVNDHHQQNLSAQRSKRYHRHSAYQIQQMESYFKECPHPDEKQRQELGRALNLSPRQVKFWFQNRRTQMKAQHERSENSQLRLENERLRMENLTMREAIKHASCATCGGVIGDAACDEHQLRLENMRLREELQRVSLFAARYFGRSASSLMTMPALAAPSSLLGLKLGDGAAARSALTMGPVPSLALGSFGSEAVGSPSVSEVALRHGGGLTPLEKPVIVDLAVSALDEILRLFHAEVPLWLTGTAASGDILNIDEYVRQFAGGVLAPRPYGLCSEATRYSGNVISSGTILVETLMDADKWMEMFPTLVARAMTLEILSPGIGASLDGALQLMYAELHVLSPLVQAREFYFLRYCKQAADNVWAIVDASVESLHEIPPPSLLRCRRKPSGCLIQDVPSAGYSQVTWLEHVEADDSGVHALFRPLVSGSVAFGARRWLATLQRQCESLLALFPNSPCDFGAVQTPEGRRGILRLAHRMSRRFCTTVGFSSSNAWISAAAAGAGAADVAGGDDVRIMTRDSEGGLLLCAATSTWLPFQRQRVFDLLCDERSRAEWDVIASGSMEKMYHVTETQNPGNAVSLLRPNGANSTQNNAIFLQQTCTDASGCLVVFGPVDYATLNSVLQGEEHLYSTPSASGFAILPDSPENRPIGLLPDIDGGSILSVLIQIIVNSMPPSGRLNMESVNTITNIIINTVHHIKAALQRGNMHFEGHRMSPP